MTQKTLLLLSLIDLLFFPYFQFVIFPFMLPFVVILCLYNYKKTLIPKFFATPFLLLISFMSLSVINGSFFSFSENLRLENIKRVIQFASSFAYFAMFYKFGQDDVFIKKLKIICNIFLIYILILTICFALNMDATNSIMLKIYGRLVQSNEITEYNKRFTYLFSDPNTCAYFLLIAIFPWMNKSKKYIYNFISLFLSLIAVICMQSRGAILAIIISLFVILRQITPKYLYNISIKNVAYLSLFFALIAVLWFNHNNMIAERLHLLTSRLHESNLETGGSRIEIWNSYFDRLNVNFIGFGFNRIIDDSFFYPHSDIVRITFSYGLISLLFFVYIFWFIAKNNLLLFVTALFPLLINTLIDEQKLFCLFLVMAGIFCAQQKKEQKKMHV